MVVLYGEESRNLCASECVRLSLGSRNQEFSRSRSSVAPRTGRARVRLWLDGIANRNQAEAWVGAELAIPVHVLEPLPAGEYYWRDLIGLRCRTCDGNARLPSKRMAGSRTRSPSRIRKITTPFSASSVSSTVTSTW